MFLYIEVQLLQHMIPYQAKYFHHTNTVFYLVSLHQMSFSHRISPCSALQSTQIGFYFFFKTFCTHRHLLHSFILKLMALLALFMFSSTMFLPFIQHLIYSVILSSTRSMKTVPGPWSPLCHSVCPGKQRANIPFIIIYLLYYITHETQQESKNIF